MNLTARESFYWKLKFMDHFQGEIYDFGENL